MTSSRRVFWISHTFNQGLPCSDESRLIFIESESSPKSYQLFPPNLDKEHKSKPLFASDDDDNDKNDNNDNNDDDDGEKQR